MKKISIDAVETVLKSVSLCAVGWTTDEFIEECKKVEKELADEKKGKKKAEEEEARRFQEYEVVKGTPSDNMKQFFDEYFRNADMHDFFYDYDGLPDEGVDETFYYKVGDKLYLVEAHCEAEWVGDWSVRKNLPGEISATNVIEVEKFEIINEDDGLGKVKI